MLNDALRQIFRYFNRYLMVPVFRLGLGIFMGNPVTSYIMVIKTIGRKSGKVRHAPVNYAIANGCVYCVSGWGQTSDWYRNMMAHPDIELIMPSGAIHGHAAVVTDPLERRVMLRQVLKNAGFAGFLEGFNPHGVSDEELEKKAAVMQLVRITPNGLGSGAFDPGNWSWILWTVLFVPMIVWWLIKKR
jgi:deazaflavin-dependent oxidoreductase (nitroreductase family)